MTLANIGWVTQRHVQTFVRHLSGSASRFLVTLLSVGLLASCSGDSGSPIAPSLSNGGSGGPVSGATVHGRVNGSVGAQSFGPAAEVSGDAAAGLTIEVLGTGQSAEVGPDGEFMITGLGAVADVVLRVSGSDVAGESQDLPLGTSLGANGTLEVELSVSAGTVRVDSLEVEDDPADDDESGDDDSAGDDDESEDDLSDDDDESADDDSADDDSADDDSTDDDSADDDSADDDSSDDDSADDDSADDDSEDDDSESDDDDSEDDDD